MTSVFKLNQNWGGVSNHSMGWRISSLCTRGTEGSFSFGRNSPRWNQKEDLPGMISRTNLRFTLSKILSGSPNRELHKQKATRCSIFDTKGKRKFSIWEDTWWLWCKYQSSNTSLSRRGHFSRALSKSTKSESLSIWSHCNLHLKRI